MIKTMSVHNNIPVLRTPPPPPSRVLTEEVIQSEVALVRASVDQHLQDEAFENEASSKKQDDKPVPEVPPRQKSPAQMGKPFALDRATSNFNFYGI